MLADFLNKVREQEIGEMEQRAEALEGQGLPSAGRFERLNALFDELIAALRYGGVDAQARVAATVDSPLDSEERKLMRRYVIEQIEHHRFEASRTEAGVSRLL
jgi:hypothetical protein